MSSKTIVALAAVLVAGAVPVWAAAEPAKAPAPPAPAKVEIGKPAPAFTLTNLNGKQVSLSDFAGKIVVLEWINPDCPVSLRHHTTRNMETLAEKLAAKGVVWLAINSTHYWTTEKNKQWAEKQKLPYTILNDQPGHVGKAYDAKTTPDMRIIDAKGVLIYAGAIDDDSGGKAANPVNYVAKAAEELLAGKAVGTPQTNPYGCSVKYPPAPRPAGPSFTLMDQNGRKVSLSDFAGKIAVLEWINPECPYVQRHYKAGTMKALAEKYDDAGVVWLAINSTNTWNIEKNKAFADQQKLPYLVLDDHEGKVGHMFDAKTTPDMRIIDAKGAVVYKGGIDDDPNGKADKPVNYVAKALDELLAGKKVSTPEAKPYGCSVKYAK